MAVWCVTVYLPDPASVALIGKILAKFSGASISNCGIVHLLSCGLHTKSARVSAPSRCIRRAPVFPIDLFERRLDQPEIPALAPVNNVHFLRFSVQEDKKLLSRHLDLEDRLIDVHRFHRVLLAMNDR